ncbi:MAG: electron transport complex subunit RsxC [Bacteroidales bacterium]|nr:electron transport complex subunit RsxC [Bacteroidales bacterium]
MPKTFLQGGVHPPECKLSKEKAIVTPLLPDRVLIPLSQHIGSPAIACVGVGDQVKTGQVIAKSSGFVSANIHASISGTVSKIGDFSDVTGYCKSALMIEREGDEWIEEIDHTETLIEDLNKSKTEIISKITHAGIVGLGGATFPSHVKLTIPPGKKCKMLLINGAECEPYLTCDHRLMLEKTEEILIGIRLLMIALEVSHAKIGIEENKADAISQFNRLIKKHPGISVVSMKTKYPQGGEKQLIKALTGQEVSPGEIPLDIGVIPFNIGTVYAIYEAVQKNKPLIERTVTLTGKKMGTPSNFRVRIGTILSDILEQAGGIPENTGKVILGGPMMGKAANSLNIPITKGCSGILFVEETESFRKPAEPCIRCAKCVSSCPMGLEPYLLGKLSEMGQFEKAAHEGITLCIECGSCSFICPANRPLLDWIRVGKNAVLKQARVSKK